ncbi:hypothetical protein D3C73_1624560 [compost metagenome]
MDYFLRYAQLGRTSPRVRFELLRGGLNRLAIDQLQASLAAAGTNGKIGRAGARAELSREGLLADPILQ